jgi:hypothetical protein
MNSVLIKNFPYFSQQDNELNPSGACNVTSIAMCLHHWGIRGDGSYPQLEDQIYQRCLDRGWSRHDPLGLKAVSESYPNIQNRLTTNGTLTDIRQAITSGVPCVLHGYFTRFGHIIAAHGFDNKGLFVHDPWGEWYEWGYDRNNANNPEKGKNLHYSWGLISRLCSPESVANPQHIWLHRISKSS